MYTRNNWLPEIFNDFFNADNMPRRGATAPAINVREGKDRYVVELAAPGLRKEDFDVNLNSDGDLAIKMERRHDDHQENAHYLRREFSYDKYEQTLILPEDVDRERISARVANGVLTVELPKQGAEEQRVSRSIEIG